MKKFIALTLMTALLLCAGTVRAAEWPEGLGPAQPYVNVPEIDLSKQLGYVMFYPSQDMPMENVCQTLYIYVPREDVKIGEGRFELRTARDGVLQRIEMSDDQRVTLRAMSETELDALHWGSGLCIEIQLLQSLDLNRAYFVHMTQGCMVTDTGVDSPEINNADQWSFSLNGEYGISAMEYRHPLTNGRHEAGVANPQTGDEVRFELVLGGGAVAAVLYSRDASVDFPVAYLEKSGSVTGTVTGDAPSWGVLFLDAEQNEVNHFEF